MRGWIFALLVCLAWLPAGAEEFRLAGRSWQRWPEAARQAKAEHKPILLVQMLGDLNETWC